MALFLVGFARPAPRRSTVSRAVRVRGRGERVGWVPFPPQSPGYMYVCVFGIVACGGGGGWEGTLQAMYVGM